MVSKGLRRYSRPQHQQGVVLVVALLILLLGATSWVLTLNFDNDVRLARQKQDRADLAQARQALIAYAVSYADNYANENKNIDSTGYIEHAGPGHFPCPDTSGNGSPNPPCNDLVAGWLPVSFTVEDKVIQLAPHLDGRSLWYIPSPLYVNNISESGTFSAAIVNPSVEDDLISGKRHLSVNDESDVVAVLIAPGPLTGDQDHTSNSITDYLEGENADSDYTFVFSGLGNDQLLTIRKRDLMPLVEKRVLGFARDWLIAYKKTFGRWPYAAPLSGESRDCTNNADLLSEGLLPNLRMNTQDNEKGKAFVAGCQALNYKKTEPFNEFSLPSWFYKNGWHRYVYYRFSEDGKKFQVNGKPVDVIVASVGSPLEGQHRGDGSSLYSALIGDYLEGENADGDDHYDFSSTSVGNDQYLSYAK